MPKHLRHLVTGSAAPLLGLVALPGKLMGEVPGSFFEFIERAPLPGETRLDLAFDTNNAQGIFKMTAA